MSQPPVPLEQVVAQIVRAPEAIQSVPGTAVRLFHIWKEQARSVASSQGLPPAERIQRFVLDTYRRFPSLWSWFCPNEEHYRVWADKGMAQIAGDADGCLRLAIEADFPSLFRTAAQRLQRVTGREAYGDWYLVYSEGGDLGGNSGTMCANLIRLAERGVGYLEFMLPHELNHQVYHRAHPGCPHSLARSIVEEGFCCYVNWLCWEGHGSPESHTGFSSADWAWAVAHEQQVIAAVLPQLEATAWETIKPYHQWHVYPWEGAVDRLAYFLGFRLCETYARRHGRDALADFYELEPMDIWTRSGYAAHA